MNFISMSFFLFLLITIILYFILPLKYRWYILLVASLGFYAFNGIEMLPFLLGASLVAFVAGRRIDGIYIKEQLSGEELSKDKKKQMQLKKKRKARFVLTVAVVILIGVLAFVKSIRYMPDNMTERMIVPLGISYFTFSIVGYIADVYWKKQKAETNFLKFTLFVAFFPKILQGPIAKYKLLAPQLIDGHRFDYQKFCFAFQLILWGFFKKLVIADRLAIFVNNVYGNYKNTSGSVLLVATIFASVQLYCDFSGCMDIASGISQVFGIELEKNFNHPFLSKNAAEFWRRWHITLGAWFKDYIYMPLVVSPKLLKLAQKVKKRFGMRASKNLMMIVPLSVVWMLTGIWHGTGLSYVLWGVYWGGLIILSSVFEPEIKRFTEILKIDVTSPSWKVFQMLRTFFLFAIGRMITIPNDIGATVCIMKRVVTDFEVWKLVDGSLLQLGLDASEFILVIIAIALLWKVSLMQEKFCVREHIASYNIVFRWGIYYVAVLIVVIFGVYGPGYDASAFVYMNY